LKLPLAVANRRYAEALRQLAADNRQYREVIGQYRAVILGYAEGYLRLWEAHLGLAEDYKPSAEKIFRLRVDYQGYAEGNLRYRVRFKLYEEKVKELLIPHVRGRFCAKNGSLSHRTDPLMQIVLQILSEGHYAPSFNYSFTNFPVNSPSFSFN